MTHLNDLSKVYLENIVESAVPGKPAERLGAVTSIPKSEQDAARERILAKTAAKRAKMKEETDIDEAVKGADPEMRRAASSERRSGDKRLSPSKGKGYADQQKQSIAYMDKVTKKNKNVVGLVTKEALDPVGQEDSDVDNDGDSDKSDKYLLNRRKAIGKAIKKKSVKEGFSNWRQDLAEVMDDEIDEKEIKEKKVNNKIKINPEFKESVEEGDGVVLLEMVEIDEVDFVVESVYGELLDEGYEEDDIEEALEYALIEAKVTYGHDTDKPYQKKTGAGQMVKAVGRLARQKLASKVSGAKKVAKQAVASGARKVAKGALGVARKMEGGDSKPSAAHTKTRSSSTYRGAGAGQKEKVSSGSYTPPTKKKAEKPADPWEGSATTPTKAKSKKAAAPKAKAPAKKKKSSKLDDLLASVRSESVIADRAKNAVADDRLSAEQEKTNASMDKLRAQSKRHEKSTSLARTQAKIAAKKSEDIARAMHPKPGVSGRRIEDPKPTGSKPSGYRIEEVQIDEKAMSRAQQRFMGMVYAAKKGEMPASAEVAKAASGMTKKQARDFAKTKHKGLPEVKEQIGSESEVDNKKEMIDQKKLANMKMLQQKQQMLQKQKLQMQKSGRLPLEAD